MSDIFYINNIMLYAFAHQQAFLSVSFSIFSWSFFRFSGIPGPKESGPISLGPSAIRQSNWPEFLGAKLWGKIDREKSQEFLFGISPYLKLPGAFVHL